MLGFYDSGIGGFSILKEVIKTLPDTNFQYLADTKILPLGNKPFDFIQQRVKVATSFLFKQGCNLVILACNTAAVNSIREIQQNWLSQNFPNKQVLSLTRPLIEKLEDEQLNSQKGLLIATKATIESGFYQQELKKIKYQNTSFIACPNLATTIENQSKNLNLVLKQELSQFKNLQQLDFLILACTHYPLIKKEIKQSFRQDIKIIDPSMAVAQKLKLYLQKHPEYKMLKKQNKFWTTKNLEKLNRDITFFLKLKPNNYDTFFVDLD